MCNENSVSGGKQVINHIHTFTVKHLVILMLLLYVSAYDVLGHFCLKIGVRKHNMRCFFLDRESINVFDGFFHPWIFFYILDIHMSHVFYCSCVSITPQRYQTPCYIQNTFYPPQLNHVCSF